MNSPHALALVLTPKERIELEDWVSSGGLVPGYGYPEVLEQLLLSIAKRVLLFQRHVNEAVIAHDHRIEPDASLPLVTKDEMQQLVIAWDEIGGRLEAIENGVGTISVDWRREVWTFVARVARAIYGREPVFDGVPCPACREFGDCMSQCPHAGLPRNAPADEET